MSQNAEPRRSLTRRTFIAGAAVAAASFALPLAPQKAYAWDSYSSDWIPDQWFCDPMHEDMTQIAYVRLLQDMTATSPAVDNVSGNVLYAADDKTYQEVVQYLRQGAFWNDVPASNLVEFIYNYLRSKLDIPSYQYNGTAGSYQTMPDVARHVGQTHAYLQDWGRALVRFSNNKRADFLHSMLGVEVDGVTYLSQKKQRDFLLQWLEAAYKYVNDETLDDNQKDIISIIDTYGQKAAGEPGESEIVQGDASGGDADRKMSAKQVKLRAIGMMCHTIEDSYNPAHTVRSYYGGSGGDASFGDILSFGNYAAQNIHAHYDHIASTDESCVDTQIRKALIGGSKSFEDAKKLADVEASVGKLYTLGLQLSSNAVYQLLSHLYKGDLWAVVEPWFSDEVFSCYFDGEESYVYDGGRRVGNIGGLANDAHSAAVVILRYIKKASDLGFKAQTEFEKILKYQKDIDTFYHRADRTQNVYRHDDFSIEQGGLEAARAIVDLYYEILFQLATDAERAAIRSWPLVFRQNLYRAVQGAGGLVQEFSLDLNGSLDQDRYGKTGEMLSLIEAAGEGDVVGMVEYATDQYFALRLDDGSGTFVCAYDKENVSVASRPSELLSGMRGVSVSFNVDYLGYPSNVMACHASIVNVSSPDRVFDTKGTVASVDGKTLVLSVEGATDVASGEGLQVSMGVPSSASVEDLAVGQRVSVSYTYDAHGFFYVAHQVLDRVASLRISGTVTRYYGGMMVVSTGLDVNERPIEMAFSYGAADFVGVLSEGVEVDVMYYPRSESQDELQDTYVKDRNGLFVPFEASRIAASSQEERTYVYVSNHDASHCKIESDLAMTSTEACTNENGICPFCGYAFDQPKPKPDPDPKPDPINPKKEPLARTGEGATPWVAAAAAVVAVGSGLAAGVAKHFRHDEQE